MGMFDTFLINHNKKQYHLQTKRFYCQMDTWQVGDFVEGSNSGVKCFIQRQFFDEKDNRIFRDEEKEGASYGCWFIVVIAHSLFAEAQVFDANETEKFIADKMRELKEKWHDSSRAINLLSEVVRLRDKEAHELRHRIRQTKELIETHQKWQTGGMPSEENEYTWVEELSWAGEEYDRLKAGENPLDILLDLLNIDDMPRQQPSQDNQQKSLLEGCWL